MKGRIGAGLLAAALAAGVAQAQDRIGVELNKLESQENACRFYVVTEGSAEALESLKLDLVLFGRDGVIARRLAVELGPLRAESRSVRLFDVAGMSCGDVADILVNDVLACGEGGDPAACLDRLALSSRADVALVR
ncbi:Tat pathway signal protein [Geminicoccaceae bacterium 1502E]|nr:Tat pathway signal protein [Geminicoccaceae bacterium 1502E]